jgi:hypothetical protein
VPKKRNFQLDKTFDDLTAPSLFDRLIQEVEVSEVPVEYIERIVVYYESGDVVELSNHDINKPIPINKEASWDEMSDSFKNVSNVKVYVNTKKLEHDVNNILDEILSFLPKGKN